MIIRQAQPSDAHAIASLHTASWQANYQNALTLHYLTVVAPQERQALWQDRLNDPAPNQQVLVAEHESKLAGFVCGYQHGHETWGNYLDNLHVDASLQGLGIGTRLIKEMARRLSDSNSTPLCLLVNQENTRAQHFYLKLGAKNKTKSLWDAPDGSAVPTYWLVWEGEALRRLTAN